MIAAEDMGLFDSANGTSLLPEYVADVSGLFGGPAKLLFTTAVRGRIVQIRWGEDCGARIHYFFDEPEGERMIRADAGRWGVEGDALMANIRFHADGAKLEGQSAARLASAQREFRDDMVGVMRKHQHLRPDEMLAIAAYFVGQLAAMQDKRRITPDMASELIARNIEIGNLATVEAARNSR